MKIYRKLLVIVSVFFTLNTFSQSNKPIANAFKLSYDYEATKNYEAAINILNTVYSESSYETNLRLAWLYYLSAKHKESVSYYLKASAIMPAATEPYWGMINPYAKLENWNDVEKCYHSILKIDTKNSKANYNLGLIYYYRKDYKEAKKYFDVSLNLTPFNYNSLLMSGWTNFYLGNKNEASVLFNKVLLYSPNDKSALEGLSLIK